MTLAVVKAHYILLRNEDFVMATCSHCGNQVMDGLTACPACGAPIEAQNYNQGYQQQGYAPNGYQQQGYAPNGYQQQGYAPNGYAPTPNGPPVKTDRSLFMYIILTIVTCGIYNYWFIHSMAKDVNQMCAEDGKKVGGLLAFIVLSYITCGIYQYYWLYKIQDRLQAAAPRYGTIVNDSGFSIIMWTTFGSLLCGLGPFIAMNKVIVSANRVGSLYNARYFNNGYMA